MHKPEPTAEPKPPATQQEQQQPKPQEPTSPKVPWTATILPWIGVAISLAALSVAYIGSLSAPDIRVTVSSPQWVMRPMQTGNFPNQKPESMLGIKLTCAFSNHGARNGVVDDILLRLQSQDDDTKWLFYPAAQVDDTKFLSSDDVVPPNALKGFVGAFYPVSVVGKQSQVFTYLFIPMLQHPNFPFKEVKPHKFQLKVLTRDDGDNKWVAQQTFTDVLSEESIAQMRLGTTIQQFPEELDHLRRDVK